MIFALAEKLGWPVFADILSSARSWGSHSHLIPHFDPLLKAMGNSEIDAAIQFGDRFVSKTLDEWLRRQHLDFYLHLSEQPHRQDPSHLCTHRVHASPSRFVSGLLPKLPDAFSNDWIAPWKEWNTLCAEVCAPLLKNQPTLTEPGLIAELAPFLSEEWALFLASSMPIRDANQFLTAPRSGTGFWKPGGLRDRRQYRHGGGHRARVPQAHTCCAWGSNLSARLKLACASEKG